MKINKKVEEKHMKNYYELLEVNPKASKEIIEKAYKVLIKKYHPDLYQGEERIYAESKSRELNEAYHILSSDFLREQYDMELEKEKQFNYTNRNNTSRQFNVQNNNSNSKEKKQTKKNEKNIQQKQHKVGTIMSMVDLVKEIFRKRDKNKGPREIKKEDKIAAVITLIIVIVLGVILCFIPATNGFMRSLIPF